MVRWLKDSFIPHLENDFKPHAMRAKNLRALAILIIAVFAGTSIQSAILSTDFFAAILPTVLVELTNHDRAEVGASPLAVNPKLVEAARLKAVDMATHGYFAHKSPDGVTPWHWFREADYAYSFAGENLAIHFTDSASVNRAWLDSPSHRANIMNLRFKEIGIATAEGMYEGHRTTFVVQMFGTPALAAPAPEVNAAPKPASATPEPPRVAAAEAPAVRGATQAAPEVILEDETFIAVRSADAPIAAQTEAPAAPSGVHAFLVMLLTSPKFLLKAAYAVLGAFILVSLILMVFIEIKKQHPLHIASALGLIALIGALAWFSNVLFPSAAILGAL